MFILQQSAGAVWPEFVAFEMVSALAEWQIVDCWSWVWASDAGCLVWTLFFGQEIDGRQGRVLQATATCPGIPVHGSPGMGLKVLKWH